jgi:ABC-type multidrug transport system fused ATPase/permease subunit
VSDKNPIKLFGVPSGLRFFLSGFVEARGDIAAIVMLCSLSSILILPIPWLTKFAIDNLLIANRNLDLSSSSVGSQWIPLALIALTAVCLRLLSAVTSAVHSRKVMTFCRNYVYSLRMSMTAFLMTADQATIERLGSTRIAAVLFQNIQDFEHTSRMLLLNAVPAAIMLVLAFAAMFALNPGLAAILLLVLPVLVVLSYILYQRLRYVNTRAAKRTSELISTLNDIFVNIRIIKVFGAQKFFLERLKVKNEESRAEGIQQWSHYYAVTAILTFLSSVSGEIFLFGGGWLVMTSRLSVGEFFAFGTYLAMIWGPITNLLGISETMQMAVASADRVVELLEAHSEAYVCAGHPRRSAVTVTGTIVFDRVEFAYGDNSSVLDGVSFTVAAGSKTALVGLSGSGKSTIANLMMGFYMPTEGRVIIDGVDITEWNLEELRQMIGVVFQDPMILDDTVENNVGLGIKYDLGDIWHALRNARLEEVVRNLPEGLQSKLGTNGGILSGGQKQRLAIARALIKNPRMIILDEATSSLDSATEHQIQESMRLLLAGRTSVVIAHRLSTIQDADQVVVIDRGRVAEIGTHSSLLRDEAGIYFNLWHKQGAHSALSKLSTE